MITQREIQTPGTKEPLLIIASLPGDGPSIVDDLRNAPNRETTITLARKLFAYTHSTGSVPDVHKALTQIDFIPQAVPLIVEAVAATHAASVTDPARLDKQTVNLIGYLHEITDDQERQQDQTGHNGNGYQTSSTLFDWSRWATNFEAVSGIAPQLCGFEQPESDVPSALQDDFAIINRNMRAAQARRRAADAIAARSAKRHKVVMDLAEKVAQQTPIPRAALGLSEPASDQPPAAPLALPADATIFEEEQTAVVKKPRKRSEQWIAREKDRKQHLAFYRQLRKYTQLDNLQSQSFIADEKERQQKKAEIVSELLEKDLSLPQTVENGTALIDQVLKNPAIDSIPKDSLLVDFQSRCAWVHYKKYNNRRLSEAQQKRVRDIALETLIIDYNPRGAIRKAQKGKIQAENNRDLLDEYTKRVVKR